MEQSVFTTISLNLSKLIRSVTRSSMKFNLLAWST